MHPFHEKSAPPTPSIGYVSFAVKRPNISLSTHSHEAAAESYKFSSNLKSEKLGLCRFTFSKQSFQVRLRKALHLIASYRAVRIRQIWIHESLLLYFALTQNLILNACETRPSITGQPLAAGRYDCIEIRKLSLGKA